MTNSIAAFALPKSHRLDLDGGAHIEFATPSLGHIAEGEEAFGGSQKDFLAALQNPTGSSDMLKAFWVLVENKASFNNDYKYMARFITPQVIPTMADVIKGALSSAMPAAKAGDKAPAGKLKKPKSTGKTPSVPSADTTA